MSFSIIELGLAFASEDLQPFYDNAWVWSYNFVSLCLIEFRYECIHAEIYMSLGC